MNDPWTPLRAVRIEGPRLPEAGTVAVGGSPQLGPPLWTLTAGAPHYRHDNVPSGGGVTADHVHPLRTLLMDQDAVTAERLFDLAEGAPIPDKVRNHRLHLPRLLGVHLLVGSRSKHYRWTSGDDGTEGRESLAVSFGGEARALARNHWREKSPRFRTLDTTDGAAATAGAGADADAGFVHVVVEPRIDEVVDWALPRVDGGRKLAGSANLVGKDDIPVPPLRLVEGRIPFLVAPGGIPWLGMLDPSRGGSAGATGKGFRLWLTPRGIEIESAAPFPGRAEPLAGTFLLAPGSVSGPALTLSLLPGRLDPAQHAAWRDAWLGAMPDGPGGEALPGFRLWGRRAGPVPAFRWTPVERNGAFARLPPVVEVPPEDVRMVLTGSAGGPAGTVDGTAAIRAERVRIAAPAEGEAIVEELRAAGLMDDGSATALIDAIQTRDDTAVLVAERATNGPPRRFAWFAAATGTGEATFAKAGADAPLLHDERRLAAVLRGAYGWPEPRLLDPLPTADGKRGAPGGFRPVDADRPLVPGFVPLAGGWLQMPFPNLRASDPGQDADLIGAIGGAPPSALDGYVRYAQRTAAATLSGYGAGLRLVADSAPWSIVVESAGAAAGVAVLRNEDGGTGATLRAARVVLGDPELSCRGLLWVSTDRPDAQEALPRLGAGPGGFIDVPFTTAASGGQPGAEDDPRVVGFRLTELSIALTNGEARQKELVLHASFNPLARPWSDGSVGLTAPGTAKAALEAAHAVLGMPEGGPAGGAPPPWPPVAWLRHPTLPLAAVMPMTRAADSSVRPLESRELAPFSVSVAPSGDGRLPLVALRWSGTGAWGRLEQARCAPVPGWPWPSAGEAERGIAFAAFGVPGVEAAPAPGASAAPWEALLAACRYDLPVLDEAFATASLPPAAVTPAPDDGVTRSDHAPAAATALDWAELGRFWQGQRRRHELARVADSHLSGFWAAAAGNRVARHKVDVGNLVAPFVWPVTLAFDPAHRLGGLPYGGLTLAPDGGPDIPILAGNAALRGVSGRFAITDGRRLAWLGDAPAESAVIDLRGWSPSTHDGDGVQFDNRGFGADPRPAFGDSTLVLRRITAGGVAYRLATLAEPLAVRSAGRTAFRFWFKDLPVGDGGFPAPAAGDRPDSDADFGAWTAGRLPFNGFEWRFYADGAKGADAARFHGFLLEPLRLLAVSFAGPGDPPAAGAARVERVEILAALSLPPTAGRPTPGGNLVRLVLAADDGPELVIRSMDSEEEHVHTLDAAGGPGGGKGNRHTVELRGRPMLTGEGLPTLGDAALAFRFHGMPFVVRGLTVTMPAGEDDPLAATWTAGGTVSPPEPGTARLRVTAVALTVPAGGPSTLTVDSIAEIQPADMPAAATEAAIVYTPGGALTVLGVTIGGDGFQEDEGAVVATLAGEAVGALCEGFAPLDAGSAKAAAMIALTAFGEAGAAEPASVALAGCVEAVVRVTGADTIDNHVALSELRVRVDAGRPLSPEPGAPVRTSPWTGRIELFGTLHSRSAIAWPAVAVADATIPVPGDGGNGRRTVTRVEGQRREHRAVYRLDAHVLPFAALAIGPGRAVTFARPWTLFATAVHELTGGGTLRWASVEALSVGSWAAILGDGESLGFAARYRNDIPARTADPDVPRPGLGRVRTVFEGALGRPFREAIATEAAKGGVIVAGGFLGFLRTGGDKEAAVLLRLPFLARLGGEPLAPGLLTQDAWDSIDLAWADTGAAREVAAADADATVPTDTTERALIDALRAGALRPKGAAAAAVAPALLVEQSFATVRPATDAGNRLAAPFWIGAAVTVKRAVVAMGAESGAVEARFTLSLVAGSIEVREPPTAGGRRLRRGLAALLRLGASVAVDRPVPPLAPVLLSGGHALVEEGWTGPAVDEADAGAVNGLASGMALAAHAQPRFAVLRTPGAVGGAGVAYTRVTLPRPVVADLPAGRTAPPGEPRFADPFRGYALGPGHEPERWLQAPHLGRIAAVRDERSGVAGLASAIVLPAQAAGPADGPEQVGGDLVWFGEKRVPVYPPLRLGGVRAPPVPWLSPAPPRVRLPDDAGVAAALHSAGYGPGTLQAFLPPGAVHLSVAERAGVMTARRAMLLAPVPEGRPFDAEHGRFGRPAQAGSSVVRQIRTPRPGPLQENIGGVLGVEHDRRPCASPLLPKLPARFVVGPADAVRGEAPRETGGTILWSALAVASPHTDGVVTDSWDGSVCLVIELDIACRVGTTGTDPATRPWSPQSVLREIAARLLPMEGREPNGSRRCRASACLVIGGTVVELRSATVLSVRACTGQPAGAAAKDGEAKDGEAVCRGRIELVLDPRPAAEAGRAGPPRADIAAAIAASAGAPVAELRLTVHPDAGTNAELGPVRKPFALSVRDGGGVPMLPEGGRRPPVTLRLPMPAVASARGALPLVPTTLLFTDPAYDAELSSPPAEDGRRVSVGIAAPPGGTPALPPGRGAVQAVLYADRRTVDRLGSVALMLDVRFERPSPPTAADGSAGVADGDLGFEENPKRHFRLSAAVQPRRGERRSLAVAGGAEPPRLALARVYELSLAALAELDGAPARLAPGDVLELSVADADALADRATFRLWDSDAGRLTPDLRFAEDRPLSRTLRLPVTERPAVEPPSALYAALAWTRTETGGAALSLPLHAQSPLPTRIDLRDLKGDLRRGLVTRTATFAWILGRPVADTRDEGGEPRFRVHVCKAERSGQTHLPEALDHDFIAPERMGGNTDGMGLETGHG